MNGKAASLLRNIEKEQGIEIWMAAETGSHSFGLQTPDSDRDIRFIFAAKNIREYLSVKPKQEVISIKHAEYEIEGWDIFKASRLLRKSNPGIFEWFHSQTFDWTNHAYVLKIKDLIKSHYSLRILGQHYYHMCLTNIKFLEKIKGNNRKAHKTAVQAARAYLMLCCLLQKGVLPPLSVHQLFHEIDMESTLYTAIAELFQAKKNKEYFSEKELLKTAAMLKGTLILTKGTIQYLPDGKEMDEDLNEIIWECLGI